MDSITYFTGISVNKLQWDRTYAKAFDDKDYEIGKTIALTATKNLNEGSLSQIFTREVTEEIAEFGIDFLLSYVPGLSAIKRLQQRNAIRSDLRYREQLASRNPWISELLSNADGLRKLSENIEKMDVTISDGTVVSDNFFSLYASNQSDSRMFAPLSRLGYEQGNQSFNVSWGYCDLPYFQNKYIDCVGIELTGKFFEASEISRDDEDFVAHVNEAFTSHFFDVVVSRALAKQFEIEKRHLERKDYFNELKRKISSIERKNMYGLVVFSNLLYLFSTVLTKKDSESSLKLFISSGNENSQFLKHLVNLAGVPTLEVVDDAEKSHLVLSLLDTEEEREAYVRDQLPQNLQGINESLKSFFSIRATGYSDGDVRKYEKFKIATPVKMFFSLPCDISGAPSPNIPIPASLSSNLDTNSERILFTVGGAEHNRALAYFLSNRAYKGKSSYLGLLDNKFDFQYAKMSVEDNYFLVGINQPVSGEYNSNFIQRTNQGWESTSLRGALLCFKYHEYKVISLYGFSAIASAMLQNLVLTRVARRKEDETLFQAIVGISNTELDIFNETSEPIIHMYRSTKNIEEIHQDLGSITGTQDTFAFMNQANRSQVAEIGEVYEKIFRRN